ncbi:MAG TPA: agmatine deiminase family protein [Methanomassiliicoccales archaeon]|nr:agmatine deiminase family protein [Methanomassiliicoccales archaeon]
MEEITPRRKGFRMPAEWARHEATWLSWPKNPLTFPAEVIEEVESVFAQMISALSQGEEVKVLVEDNAMEERMLRLSTAAGADIGRIKPMRIRSSDVWIRDYGPTFLINQGTGDRAAVKWRFNAWGGKYDDLLYDDITGEDVAKAAEVQTFRPGIVMEGGSIDVNGQGSLLTTEQCLLNKNRNPQLGRREIESYLKEYLGAPNVIWLKSGIEGDDTDGHVDDFARFVSADKVVCSYSQSRATSNSAVLKVNLEVLRASVDQDGRPIKVGKLPMPKPLRLEEERRYLPASYANFYIGNECVLLPVFKDRNDRKAIGLLENAFPERRIVPICAARLVYGYGGIHCVTQQEPLGGPS